MTQPCGSYSGADALTEAHVQGVMGGVGLWELLDVFPKPGARTSLSGRTSAWHYWHYWLPVGWNVEMLLQPRKLSQRTQRQWRSPFADLIFQKCSAPLIYDFMWSTTRWWCGWHMKPSSRYSLVPIIVSAGLVSMSRTTLQEVDPKWSKDAKQPKANIRAINAESWTSKKGGSGWETSFIFLNSKVRKVKLNQQLTAWKFAPNVSTVSTSTLSCHKNLI